MSFAVLGTVGAVGAGLGVAGGLAKIGMGIFGSKKAKAEQRRAQAELRKRQKEYEMMDTSNPYANMENTMEDLTVNQQQAEFEKQQQEQQRANIMQQMQGAAGGSGVAALAQAMANQGAVQAQKASASIGQQERANQLAAAQQAAQIQSQERQGQQWSQQQELNKSATLLGMSQERVAAANQAYQQQQEMIAGGIGDITSVGTSLIGAAGKYKESEHKKSRRVSGGVDAGGRKRKKKK